MTDLLTFPGLFVDQDEATIRDRWTGWANEGLDPDQDVEQWTDTREGSHFWIMTTGGIREAARWYDLSGTEVVAASFPQYAWGEYLDDHGELRNLARLAATPATGIVTFEGAPDTVIGQGTVVGVPPETEDAPAPEFATDATVTIPVDGDIDVPVTATVAGVEGVVGPLAISALITPVPGVESVSNADGTAGGTDTENDPAYRSRILTSFVGVAVANALYYQRFCLNYPGVGRCTVIANGNGPGTVTIIVATESGAPVSAGTLAGLQAALDPGAGNGAGAGQTGATITVSTSTLLAVAVSGDASYEPGYSADGAGNTIPLRDAITAAVQAYVATVQPGGTIFLSKIISAIVGIRGVTDVAAVTINGVAGNLAVASSPPKSPALTIPITLT